MATASEGNIIGVATAAASVSTDVAAITDPSASVRSLPAGKFQVNADIRRPPCLQVAIVKSAIKGLSTTLDQLTHDPFAKTRNEATS